MFLWLKSHKKLVNNVFLLVKCVHAKKKKKEHGIAVGYVIQ